MPASDHFTFVLLFSILGAMSFHASHPQFGVGEGGELQRQVHHGGIQLKDLLACNESLSVVQVEKDAWST